MQVKLGKAKGRAKCRHQECKRNPEYIVKDRIKSGSTCAIISIRIASGWYSFHYCRDCIDLIFEDIKKVLNPKLWIFH